MSRILVVALTVLAALGAGVTPAWAGLVSPDGGPVSPVTVLPRTAPSPASGHILMMDTATTPTLAQVKAWQASSPYDAIAVYIPEKSAYDVRYDKTQTNLTADWVREVRAGGWQVLPIYVGLQASCSSYSKKMSANATTARAQGMAMAADAADSVYRLGLPVGAPIAFDLEAYPTDKPKCSAAAKAMLGGWTQRLHQLGRNSAVYGSVSSTVRDVVAATRADSTWPTPDALWLARWDGNATTDTSDFPSGMWTNRRLHQFAGGGSETYGGVTLNVDESAVQPTAFQLPKPDSTPPVLAVAPVRATRSGHATLTWRMSDGSGVARYQVQIKTGRHWTSPKSLKKTKKVKYRVSVKAGSKSCARARGTDRAGNTSGWLQTCVYRWGYGSKFHGKHWKRSGNSLVMKRPAVAKGPVVSGRKISVRLRGGVPVQVFLGSTLIGTVQGSGVHTITLPAARTGRLILRPAKAGKLAVLGYLALP
ncbi:MAG: DUF1906 domain-containing protein [Nocardioides sp.]|uniref:DUF1906 domain-containing protein n=1 Tax=Nocardioides sp. TaxID=35761 RepID=UPI0039E69F95